MRVRRLYWSCGVRGNPDMHLHGKSIRFDYKNFGRHFNRFKEQQLRRHGCESKDSETQVRSSRSDVKAFSNNAPCRSEIEFLEKSVTQEREKYQLSTQAMSSGLSAIPVMAINDSVISVISCDSYSSFFDFCLLSLHYQPRMPHTSCHSSCQALLKTFSFSPMF